MHAHFHIYIFSMCYYFSPGLNVCPSADCPCQGPLDVTSFNRVQKTDYVTDEKNYYHWIYATFEIFSQPTKESFILIISKDAAFERFVLSPYDC